ncbi:MAG TPA: FtsX-like permease family protein [Thermoanaerobaculia bacterium]|jgi:putative ABC transport system permease protein
MPIGPIIRAMRHNRMRFALIIIEIAMTLAIVTNCVNMILDERKQMLRESGFDDQHLLAVGYSAFGKEFEDDSFVRNQAYADLRAIESIPGVKAAAMTYFLPWQGGGSSDNFIVEGRRDKVQAQLYGATEGIFETLGVQIVAGRGFVRSDYPPPNEPTTKCVISLPLAKLFFGDANPIGKIITTGYGERPREVIGVIGKFYNPYSWNIGEYVLFTPAVPGGSDGASFLVRAEPGAMAAVAAAIEPRLLQVNGNRVFRSQTIGEIKDNFFSGGRLVVTAMTAVIVVLIFVTALGIVGITSLSVSERTKQIGTRRALGATKADILKHFLAENWIVTTAGLVLGVAATYGLNYLLVSNFTDVKMPWYLVGVGMVLLWLNGIIATIPPALRAARVPPAIATRSV